MNDTEPDLCQVVPTLLPLQGSLLHGRCQELLRIAGLCKEVLACRVQSLGFGCLLGRLFNRFRECDTAPLLCVWLLSAPFSASHHEGLDLDLARRPVLAEPRRTLVAQCDHGLQRLLRALRPGCEATTDDCFRHRLTKACCKERSAPARGLISRALQRQLQSLGLSHRPVLSAVELGTHRLPLQAEAFLSALESQSRGFLLGREPVLRTQQLLLQSLLLCRMPPAGGRQDPLMPARGQQQLCLHPALGHGGGLRCDSATSPRAALRDFLPPGSPSEADPVEVSLASLPFWGSA
mmetsp:Transcript_100465/g.225150  ORF Transcript_100465/g.225150 Transcript_100465/m.225150 type:complete len:293 (+) Transcript_100465:254-1132(+)